MSLSLEHVATIEADASRILEAYATDRDARIPWSDRWTVRSVARHVAGAHHVVAGIVLGRPTADFGLLDSIEQPAKDDPAFPAWSASGSAAVCDALRTTDLDEPCWTSIPAGRGVRYWLRRITHETTIHRWDAELGAGIDHAPIDPALAADGVDEYLTLGLPLLRAAGSSPAAPPLLVECTDTEASWHVELADGGGCSVGAASDPVATTLRGPAAGLLLWLYGRAPHHQLGIEVTGDRFVVEHRAALRPS
jgi:uncharacterized protein (TIGR03083 family)